MSKDKVYLIKWYCHHCGNFCQKHEIYPAAFVPASVICMKCGRKLKGHRVSTADGKTMVWVEYR